MKFDNDAWSLWQTKFPGADRERAEAAITNEQADFLRTAGGNEAKALGLLTLTTARDIARTFHLNEHFVLKRLIYCASRSNRSRLKKAIRLARGGH